MKGTSGTAESLRGMTLTVLNGVISVAANEHRTARNAAYKATAVLFEAIADDDVCDAVKAELLVAAKDLQDLAERKQGDINKVHDQLKKACEPSSPDKAKPDPLNEL